MHPDRSLYSLGETMINSDDVPEPIRPFVMAIWGKPDFYRRIAVMLTTFAKKLDKTQLGLLAMECRQNAPDDPFVWHHTEYVIRRTVPGWHFKILGDKARNRVYNEALKRNMPPGADVLEIGTGSGILAMMAARAGAGHVYTVEINPVMARTARENIRSNGLENKITVICKNALAVEIGADIPRRCGLFVHELIPNGFLGEQIIALTRYAKSQLLHPSAVMLPHRLAARAALVEARRLDIAGLGLPAMNWLAPAHETAGSMAAPDLLSRPRDICILDLDQKQFFPPEHQRFTFYATRDGKAAGVVQWIRFQFPEGGAYENMPGIRSCWCPLFYPFPKPVRVSAGDQLDIIVTHNETRLTIGLE